MINLAPRHDPLTTERFDTAPGQQHALLVVDDAGDDGGLDRLFTEFHKRTWRVARKYFRATRSSLLVCLSLYRGNTQAQGVQFDETFGVGLVVNFICLEGRKVNIEQAVGL